MGVEGSMGECERCGERVGVFGEREAARSCVTRAAGIRLLVETLSELIAQGRTLPVAELLLSCR